MEDQSVLLNQESRDESTLTSNTIQTIDHGDEEARNVFKQMVDVLKQPNAEVMGRTKTIKACRAIALSRAGKDQSYMKKFVDSNVIHNCSVDFDVQEGHCTGGRKPTSDDMEESLPSCQCQNTDIAKVIVMVDGGAFPHRCLGMPRHRGFESRVTFSLS